MTNTLKPIGDPSGSSLLIYISFFIENEKKLHIFSSFFHLCEQKPVSKKYQNKSYLKCNRRHSETSNLSICWASAQSSHSSNTPPLSFRPSIHPSIKQATWKHTHRYCRCPRPAKALSEISENVFEFNSLCRTKRKRQR